MVRKLNVAFVSKNFDLNRPGGAVVDAATYRCIHLTARVHLHSEHDGQRPVHPALERHIVNQFLEFILGHKPSRGAVHPSREVAEVCHRIRIEGDLR